MFTLGKQISVVTCLMGKLGRNFSWHVPLLTEVLANSKIATASETKVQVARRPSWDFYFYLP